jgi:hypothetical protein
LAKSIPVRPRNGHFLFARVTSPTAIVTSASTGLIGGLHAGAAQGVGEQARDGHWPDATGHGSDRTRDVDPLEGDVADERSASKKRFQL